MASRILLGVVFAISGCGRAHFDLVGASDGGTSVDGATDDGAMTAGLVVHYTFDDFAAVYHDSARSHDGSCTTCPGWTNTARVGFGAIAFTGTQCVTIADDVELRPTTFTVALWINPTTGGSLFSRPLNGATSNLNSTEIVLSAGTNIFAAVDNTSASTVPAAAGWSHVALRYDGAFVSIYIDGGFRRQAPTGPPTYAVDNDLLGCDINNGGEVAHYTGDLDDFRFYDRALDPSEIAALAAM